ncbi:hypothetical protein BKA82DRAFT_1002466 [Pisolithus tinctorius]|nr:hypothetical protein BKA82DRAFT_1002466 [Pisolithus tinctorius]
MLSDPSTAPHLKQWLVRTLEPICDAEPGALADYVLALLKHNVPESEMRKELTIQLDEFLEKEGPPFIDTLFTVLRTKSYLPYDNTLAYPSSSTHHPNDVGIPIPLDGLIQNNSTSPERGQKRSLEYDDHRPVKGPRLSASGPFSRYSDAQDYRVWEDRSDKSGMGGVNGQRIQSYQPPDRRGICRDYHKNGYCARGALCKYSHGDDAFVPSQLFPMNGSGPLPFLPMFPPFAIPGPSAAYDPHEARMDMRPGPGMMDMNGRAHQRPPLIPRAHQEEHSRSKSTGELPVIQDLTPQDAALLKTSLQPGQSSIQDTLPTQQQSEDLDVNMVLEGDTTSPSARDMRIGFEPRGARGGRGTFAGNVQNFRPGRRTDKTLVIEKIPHDKLSLDAVNSWFKRFGTVTNVAIDVHNAKALVSFSEHHEAVAAWKSEDAVFNNRFVKVFWHRPLEGHGQKGARMLAASAPLVASISSRPSASANAASPPSPVQAETPTPAPAPTAVPPRKLPVSNTASDLATKQRLLEQRIAEQKSLMLALATATSEEKKQIMARLRKLGEEVQPAATSASAAGIPQSPSPAAGRATSDTPQASDHEQRERERLDKELELHSATSGRESTEELQARLAKLREEAATLGITEYGSPAPGAYRSYRGRGRGGRSFHRGAGRGGPPRGSMKLDNRPKQLLIKAVADDAVPAVRSWFETTGQLESVDTVDGNVVVGFRTRAAAEQALAKGNDIPSIGTVQVTWHTAQQRPSSGSQAPASSGQQTDKGTGTEEPIRDSPPSPRPQEEEVVSSGWGDAGEDGMGF